ncbi:MAG: protease modulator HflC [bacterium]
MEKQRLLIISIIVLVATALGLAQSFFIVDETEQAIVVQMGKPVCVITTPGLRTKKPFVQRVVRFDNRMLEYNPSVIEISTKDNKNIEIDSYFQWRIADPLKFLESVGSESQAQSRLDDIIHAELRAQLGLRDLSDVITNDRQAMMEKVTEASRKKVQSYGIEILDIRIKRSDLPPEDEKRAFERMQEEKQMEARRYRSEGEEEALKIRAQADREKKIILADAYKKAQKIRGEGEAKAMKIYADAYNQNPDFYSFVRTLDAYRKTLKENTIFLFSEDNEFLKYLKGSHGKQKPIRK